MDEEELNDLDSSIGDSLHSEDNDELVNLADVSSAANEVREEYTVEYKILHPDQLTKFMSEIIKDVQQVTQINSTYIRLLLAHFKWDKDALIEFYFEHGKAKTYLESAICDPDDFANSKAALSCRSTDSVLQTQSVCNICYMTKDSFYGLVCGHIFCVDCWKHYLKWKIMEESEADRIYCPSPDCRLIVEDDVAFGMIEEPHVKRQFQKLTANSFVSHSRSLTWCPGVNCGHAVRCFGPHEPYQITCTSCSECFCFACGQSWHDPVLCYQLKLWLQKIERDSGTLGWIAANTKECPKCHATIEKNGGCNHMTCRNVDCKYEFCWVCLDRWEPHGSRWYSCNRFDESSSKVAREAQLQSRVALDRYLFYFERYWNHAQSLKFEHRLITDASVQSKLESIELHGTSWIDFNFFKMLVDILVRCRRTLMYTYVFAFFLKSNNHSLIFESNQSDLELSTEQLSEFVDRDLTAVNLTDLKQRTQDKARYCESRRHVLLDHVHEGYDKGFWEQGDVGL